MMEKTQHKNTVAKGLPRLSLMSFPRPKRASHSSLDLAPFEQLPSQAYLSFFFVLNGPFLIFPACPWMPCLF